MRRIMLTPRWIAFHLAMLLVVCSLAALGWWQLGVFQESSARAEIRDRRPVPLASIAGAGRDLGPAAERAVVATGRYLTELTLQVPDRVRHSRLGAYTVTPLQTAGGVLAVLRGWTDDPAAAPATVPSGRVTVTGHLLPPQTRARPVRSAPLTPGQIALIAVEPVSTATGVPPERLYAGYLLLEDEQPAPVSPPERLELSDVAPLRGVGPWQNLSYAALWWVFAGAAAVFWFSAVRSAVRSTGEPSPADQELRMVGPDFADDLALGDEGRERDSAGE
ncbi:MAG: SURF1 family protein [Jiangellaceae bacterium]|nr:SURF1 family protein [Jiangellaceae bacterium]